MRTFFELAVFTPGVLSYVRLPTSPSTHLGGAQRSPCCIEAVRVDETPKGGRKEDVKGAKRNLSHANI